MLRYIHVIFCILFSFSVLNSSAQGYDKFLDNTTWYTGYTLHHPPLHPIWWRTTVDTIVGSHTYKIVENDLTTSLFYIPKKIYLREDTINKQVFYLDTGMVEHLWYDFGLNIGDSIKDQFGDYQTVQSFDTIQTIWGMKRRIKFIPNPYNQPILIEGVGWEDGREDFLRFHVYNTYGWHINFTSCIYKNGIQEFRFDKYYVQSEISCQSMCPSVGTEDSLSANYMVICPGDSVIVVGPCDSNIYWTTAQNPAVILTTSDTLRAQPSSTTDYVWHGTLKNDTVTVEIKKNINVDLGNDTSSCLNKPVTLKAILSDSIVEYYWSDNSRKSSIKTKGSGVYWLRVRDSLGCFQSFDTITYTAIAPPLVSIDPYDIVNINSGLYALTTGSPAGGNYFGTGVNSTNFDPKIAGVGNHSIYYAFQDTGALACSDTAVKIIEVSEYTSIDQLNDASTPIIFPNPVKNQLHIQLTEGTNEAVINLYDLNGKQYSQIQITSPKVVLDVSTLKSGIYVLEVQLSDKIYHSKFVKE